MIASRKKRNPSGLIVVGCSASRRRSRGSRGFHGDEEDDPGEEEAAVEEGQRRCKLYRKTTVSAAERRRGENKRRKGKMAPSPANLRSMHDVEEAAGVAGNPFPRLDGARRRRWRRCLRLCSAPAAKKEPAGEENTAAAAEQRKEGDDGTEVGARVRS